MIDRLVGLQSTRSQHPSLPCPEYPAAVRPSDKGGIGSVSAFCTVAGQFRKRAYYAPERQQVRRDGELLGHRDYASLLSPARECDARPKVAWFRSADRSREVTIKGGREAACFLGARRLSAEHFYASRNIRIGEFESFQEPRRPDGRLPQRRAFTRKRVRISIGKAFSTFLIGRHGELAETSITEGSKQLEWKRRRPNQGDRGERKHIRLPRGQCQKTCLPVAGMSAATECYLLGGARLLFRISSAIFQSLPFFFHTFTYGPRSWMRRPSRSKPRVYVL